MLSWLSNLSTLSTVSTVSTVRKKDNFFLRCALVGKIPADSEVQRIGIQLASACCCCAEPHVETPSHILIHGDLARATWGYFGACLGVVCSQSDSLLIRFMRWSSMGSLKSMYGFTCYLLSFAICWTLWTLRNRARYGGLPSQISSSISKVQSLMRDVLGFFQPKLNDSESKHSLLSAVVSKK